MPKSTHGMLACHLLLKNFALKAFCNYESNSNGQLGLEKGLDNVIFFRMVCFVFESFLHLKKFRGTKVGENLDWGDPRIHESSNPLFLWE